MLKFFGGSSSIFFFKSLLWYVVESGVYGKGLFRLLLLVLFFGFLLIRFPYVLGLEGLVLCIFLFVLGLFLAAAGCRLVYPSIFLAEFVSEGVPFGFGLVVCGIEVLSYLVRPLVLMLRPIINLSFGWVLSDVCVGSLCFWGFVGPIGSGFLFLICYFGVLFAFFYEWCISCVQWYIVESIVVVESEA